MSECWMRKAKAGKSCLIVSSDGGGSLLRHKFTITQVTFLKNDIGISGEINLKRGSTTPSLITRSLHWGPSPIL